MKQKRASTTAEYMALFRALESYRSKKERLFNDRLAIGFLKPSLRMAMHLSRIPFIGGFVPWSSNIQRTDRRQSY